MAYSFTIPAGTKVLSSRRGMVEIRGDAYINGATRDPDGAFRYTLDNGSGREIYIASAGTVRNVCRDNSRADEMVHHRAGLVWLDATSA